MLPDSALVVVLRGWERRAVKYTEISIAFGSKRWLCAVGRRRFTRGYTDLDMRPDSSVYEYIPRMHGSQSDCDRRVIWC